MQRPLRRQQQQQHCFVVLAKIATIMLVLLTNQVEAQTSSPSATFSPSSMPVTSPPTLNPSPQPSVIPTENPSAQPTMNPSPAPSRAPTMNPSPSPSSIPSERPTMNPSPAPSSIPSDGPTMNPSPAPSSVPSPAPSLSPSAPPSTSPPTPAPSATPSMRPTIKASANPTEMPSPSPSETPTIKPSASPTITASSHPTASPTTSPPTAMPSPSPSMDPTATVQPSFFPTISPFTTFRLDELSMLFTGINSLTPQSLSDFEEFTKTHMEQFFDFDLTVTVSVVGFGTDGDRRLTNYLRRELQASITIIYNIELVYRVGDAVNLTPQLVASQPFARPQDRDQFLVTLQSGGNFVGVTDVDPVILPDTPSPTAGPTTTPSSSPSSSSVPSVLPSSAPTMAPSPSPSVVPSAAPTMGPTTTPSMQPTMGPTTTAPPTQNPANASPFPSSAPTLSPSAMPSEDDTGGGVGPTPTSPTAAPAPGVQGGGGDDGGGGGLSTLAIILIAAGGGLGLILAAVGLYMMSRQSGDGGGYSVSSPSEPPKDIAASPSGPDEVSAIPDPQNTMENPTGDGSLAGYGDQSVATVDYDYSKAYGGGGDTSVSSAGGTFGSNTQGLSAVDPANNVATGASLRGVGGGGFSDTDSFEAHYRDPTANVKEEIIDIFAPPGKLGVVIDTPDDGAPVVHAVKDSSVIADKIQVGDKLVAVDDEDVRSMTAIKVSKLISRKSANASRKLSVIRTTVIE